MTAIVIGQSLGNAYSSCPTPRVRMAKATQGDRMGTDGGTTTEGLADGRSVGTHR